ncbi:MAG TPA: 3D domain-containing protein [Kofleriaceae bacterium]|nr:3D domain-containing protein [Kofleriaceae bacterium]
MRGATAVIVLLAACGGGTTGDTVDGGVADDAVGLDAPRPEAGPSLGSFQLTYYWVASEEDYPGTASEELYDASCDVLETVTPGFADAIDLEGTGRLIDGRLLNVAGTCGCPRSPCFVEAGAMYPWGIGVQNRPLVPFRSIAVDRDVIAYGTALYVPELDGELVPGDAPWGDFVHDGCVLAADTGGGIVDLHIDWFVGLRAAYRTLDLRLGLDAVTVHEGGARCP